MVWLVVVSTEDYTGSGQQKTKLSSVGDMSTGPLGLFEDTWLEIAG